MARGLARGVPEVAPAVAVTGEPEATPVEVVAAGGLVVRPGPDGPEVLLVHRPRYDDWSFPKGKQDPGETNEETALREVAEETGLTCVLGTYLGPFCYRDHLSRWKEVHYWIMEPASGGETPFEPGDEVDRLLWCRPEDAATLLSYERDRALLGRLGG
jgi:8-oxo-dGTP diphosphatase